MTNEKRNEQETKEKMTRTKREKKLTSNGFENGLGETFCVGQFEQTHSIW